MKKPDQCCGMGTYEHQIPMAIRGRRREIDLCVADIVAALVAPNIQTEASCCGHGKLLASVMLEDGRYLIIYPDRDSWQEAERTGHHELR
jgi:hypothetical protein